MNTRSSALGTRHVARPFSGAPATASGDDNDLGSVTPDATTYTYFDSTKPDSSSKVKAGKRKGYGKLKQTSRPASAPVHRLEDDSRHHSFAPPENGEPYARLHRDGYLHSQHAERVGLPNKGTTMLDGGVGNPALAGGSTAISSRKRVVGDNRRSLAEELRRNLGDDLVADAVHAGATYPIRRGKVRARPASAHHPSRVTLSCADTTPTTPPTASVFQREHYLPPRPSPPPWEDNIELEIGGGGTSTRNAGIRSTHNKTQGVVADSRAPFALTNGRGGADSYLYPKEAGNTMDTPSLVQEANIALLGTIARDGQHAPVATGAMGRGGGVHFAGRCAAAPAAAAGRPYMTREERMAESSKKAAQLRIRREVEFWRAEAAKARQDAASLRNTLHYQQDHAEAVLRKTAQELPLYSYGLGFGSVDARVCPHEETPSNARPKLLLLETRRELEKSLVVRQLRDQISRLSDRLVDAETELAEVKRSCQFTALTEMRTVVEEYMNEATRLRAELSLQGSQRRPTLERVGGVIDVPTVSISSPKSTASNTNPPANVTPSKIKLRNLQPSDQSDKVYGHDHRDVDKNSAFEYAIPRSEARCSPSARGGHLLPEGFSSPLPNSTDPRSASASPPRGKAVHTGHIPGVQDSTRGFLAQGGRGEWRSGVGLKRWEGGGVKRRPRGDNRVRRRAVRVGSKISPVLPAEIQSQRRNDFAIDSPVRGGTPGTSSRWEGVGVRGGGGGAGAKMMTEMEMDVMKGLVLAQQQRIERQRLKMQELEADLREHRLSAMGVRGRGVGVDRWRWRAGGGRERAGGDGHWLPRPRTAGWPSAVSGNDGTRRSPRQNGRKHELLSCRSAPAGLDRLSDCQHATATKQKAAGVTGINAVTSSKHLQSCDFRINEHNRAGVAEDSGMLRGFSENGSRKISFQTTTYPIDDEGFGKQRDGFREHSLTPKSSTTATVHNATVHGENADGTSSETISRPDRGPVCGTGCEEDAGCSAGGESCETATGVGAGYRIVAAEEKVPPSSLPEGWAEAVDGDTGHVYYFSDIRSTWVRPTAPATPRATTCSLSTNTQSNDDRNYTGGVSGYPTKGNSSSSPTITNSVAHSRNGESPAASSSASPASSSQPGTMTTARRPDSTGVNEPLSQTGMNRIDLVEAAKALAEALSTTDVAPGGANKNSEEYAAENVDISPLVGEANGSVLSENGQKTKDIRRGLAGGEPDPDESGPGRPGYSNRTRRGEDASDGEDNGKRTAIGERGPWSDREKMPRRGPSNPSDQGRSSSPELHRGNFKHSSSTSRMEAAHLRPNSSVCFSSHEEAIEGHGVLGGGGGRGLGVNNVDTRTLSERRRSVYGNSTRGNFVDGNKTVAVVSSGAVQSGERFDKEQERGEVNDEGQSSDGGDDDRWVGSADKCSPPGVDDALAPFAACAAAASPDKRPTATTDEATAIKYDQASIYPPHETQNDRHVNTTRTRECEGGGEEDHDNRLKLAGFSGRVLSSPTYGGDPVAAAFAAFAASAAADNFARVATVAPPEGVLAANSREASLKTTAQAGMHGGDDIDGHRHECGRSVDDDLGACRQEEPPPSGITFGTASSATYDDDFEEE